MFLNKRSFIKNTNVKKGDIISLEGNIGDIISLEGNIPNLSISGKGVVFIPHISNEGILSWTNDGGLENPLPVNIFGKSAYQYATEAGYTGTEQEFAEKLASNSTNFTVDETLSLENGVLKVNTTLCPEEDNTLPITSAGVYCTLGNIQKLLEII